MSNNNNALTLGAPSAACWPWATSPTKYSPAAPMGDGLAIDPLNDSLYAPCDGEIIHVARTGHALTLRAQNGAELLMHVGIDTVELTAKGSPCW